MCGLLSLFVAAYRRCSKLHIKENCIFLKNFLLLFIFFFFVTWFLVYYLPTLKFINQLPALLSNCSYGPLSYLCVNVRKFCHCHSHSSIHAFVVSDYMESLCRYWYIWILWLLSWFGFDWSADGIMKFTLIEMTTEFGVKIIRIQYLNNWKSKKILPIFVITALMGSLQMTPEAWMGELIKMLSINSISPICNF